MNENLLGKDVPAHKLDRRGHPIKLSPKQEEVLRLITQGKSNKEAAVALNRGVRAVESLRDIAYRKIRFVTGRTDVNLGNAYKLALIHNMVKPCGTYTNFDFYKAFILAYSIKNGIASVNSAEPCRLHLKEELDRYTAELVNMFIEAIVCP